MGGGLTWAFRRALGSGSFSVNAVLGPGWGFWIPPGGLERMLSFFCHGLFSGPLGLSGHAETVDSGLFAGEC